MNKKLAYLSAMLVVFSFAYASEGKSGSLDKRPRLYYIPFSEETDIAITAEILQLNDNIAPKLKTEEINRIEHLCRSAHSGKGFSNLVVRLVLVPRKGSVILADRDGHVKIGGDYRQLTRSQMKTIQHLIEGSVPYGYKKVKHNGHR